MPSQDAQNGDTAGGRSTKIVLRGLNVCLGASTCPDTAANNEHAAGDSSSSYLSQSLGDEAGEEESS